MKNLAILTAVLAVVLGFAACEKQNTGTTETVAVTVTSPTEGQMFHNGNSLNVNVTFTDPTELHNYSILVVNTTASDTVFNVSGHKHSTSYTVDSTITLNVSAHSDFELHANVSNHAGETAHKHVNFHVHP